MGNSEDTRKAKQFERLYTAILVLLVAILLLISILYTPAFMASESCNFRNTYQSQYILWSEIPTRAITC